MFYKKQWTAMSLTIVLAWFGVLIVLGACNPTSQTGIQTPTETAFAPEGNLTVAASNREAILETPTPIPTVATVTESSPLSTEPVVVPSPTPQPVLEIETITPTLTPTLEAELQNVTGYLFVYNPVGIQQVTLADGAFQNLLTAEATWLDWGASFAQNRKYLAYWVKTAEGTELWFTSLPEWRPQRILELKDVEYDFATPLWGVNDRYLLFNLSVTDNSGPLEELKTIRTYIIDTETMELVNQPYWPGDCSILATSPLTSQLALWCYTSEEESGQEFLVLEPDETPWLTQETPEPLIDDCLIYLICAWSQDGVLAAYVAREHYPESLFYTLVDNPSSVQLDDKRTKSYSFLAWSPNSQFLYYTGACVEAGIQCPNVISIPEQKIIWRAKGDNNWGEIKVAHIVWSPDSRFLAIPILGETDSGIEQQVLFFDVMTEQEVTKISEVGGVILDMVWVAD